MNELNVNHFENWIDWSVYPEKCWYIVNPAHNTKHKNFKSWCIHGIKKEKVTTDWDAHQLFFSSSIVQSSAENYYYLFIEVLITGLLCHSTFNFLMKKKTNLFNVFIIKLNEKRLRILDPLFPVFSTYYFLFFFLE